MLFSIYIDSREFSIEVQERKKTFNILLFSDFRVKVNENCNQMFICENEHEVFIKDNKKHEEKSCELKFLLIDSNI